MKLIGKTYLDGKKAGKQSCCAPAVSASGTGLQMFTASLPGSAAVCVRRWASGRRRGNVLMGSWVLREAALRRDSSLRLLETFELCKDWVV